MSDSAYYIRSKQVPKKRTLLSTAPPPFYLSLIMIWHGFVEIQHMYVIMSNWTVQLNILHSLYLLYFRGLVSKHDFEIKVDQTFFAGLLRRRFRSPL